MKPITTILEGNAARVGLSVHQPDLDEPPAADANLDVTVIVRDDAGVTIPATLEPLEERGPWVFAIRFLPPSPGEFYVRVEASGDFDAAVEGRVNVVRSGMPAAA